MHAPPGARCALVQLPHWASVATPHAVDTYVCVHITYKRGSVRLARHGTCLMDQYGSYHQSAPPPFWCSPF